ncbi:hypothetical protein Dda_4067 [Drechslerella dactyloides]|uniref:Survival protein SurE-like phosphatase/nucleotidase domain-containing protein n=1 Tax=Drechslerella dactyloides TaxID=74499 RepID=A0AAD6NKC5_DREDA|nr:hypothetical protein Dda_4067 [Drechslerella dactyloides]
MLPAIKVGVFLAAAQSAVARIAPQSAHVVIILPQSNPMRSLPRTMHSPARPPRKTASTAVASPAPFLCHPSHAHTHLSAAPGATALFPSGVPHACTLLLPHRVRIGPRRRVLAILRCPANTRNTCNTHTHRGQTPNYKLQAQWNWGGGHPTGTVEKVAEHGSISIQSNKGNTVTRKADPDNPAVQLSHDGSGHDVVKRASELDKVSGSSKSNEDSQDKKDKKDDEEPQKEQKEQNGEKDQEDGKLNNSFPKPRQHAPITRPPDTEEQKREADLPLDEHIKEVEARDKRANGDKQDDKQDDEMKDAESADDKPWTPERQPAFSPEKQPADEASVGEKRERAEEQEESDTSPAPAQSNGEHPAAEPEAKKAKVDEPATNEEPPKKKSGRPKREDSKTGPQPVERKNSVSSRTRSKATSDNSALTVQCRAEYKSCKMQRKLRWRRAGKLLASWLHASASGRRGIAQKLRARKFTRRRPILNFIHTTRRRFKMHILLTNDDGPPGPASPYITYLVEALRARSHTVSVCIPADQKSWIGKAHIIGHHPHPTFYRPDTNSVHDTPRGDGGDEWVLINGTPASCTQIGLFHLFRERPPIDLVISGPNFGKNTSAVYALSSGTMGGAMEAALSGGKAISVSYAYRSINHDHNPRHIAAVSTLSARIIDHLYKNWPADGSVDMYSINLPVDTDVDNAKILFTHILQNTWGGCYAAVRTAADEEDPNALEKANRDAEENPTRDAELPAVPAPPAQNGEDARKVMEKYKFRWAPRFSDVEKTAAQPSAEGSDAWALRQGYVSVTPLKANFLHGPGIGQELTL